MVPKASSKDESINIKQVPIRPYCPPVYSESKLADIFAALWPVCTSDNNLTLNGFRRFKTAHLFNLRFMEEEIASLDHQIYQAGLSLGHSPSAVDRLGLKHSIRDQNVPKVEETINLHLVIRLRTLLKEYDAALASFNQIMQMETFALADNQQSLSQYSNLTLSETYKTRLIRADLPPRITHDAVQRGLHKILRAIWNFRQHRRPATTPDTDTNIEDGTSSNSHSSQHSSHQNWPSQNTILFARVIGRFIVGIVAGSFLVVPLVLLSYQSTQEQHLVTISVWIAAFAFIVSLSMQGSSQETMAATAAYAAVLSVFVSNAVS